MYPDRKTAEALLAEAEPHNPGPWGDHSRIAAQLCRGHRPRLRAGRRQGRMCWGCSTTSGGGTASGTSAMS